MRQIALALLALAVPSPSWAEDAPPRRAFFLPTAHTAPAREVDLTLYELALPGIAYGVNDRVQVGFAATRIPTAETILLPAAKVVLARAEGATISAFGGVAAEIPDVGVTGYLPMAGIAASRDFTNVTATLAVFTASPTSPRGTDRVVDLGTSVVWRVSRRFDVIAEQHVRAIAPEAQVGATTIAGTRIHLGAVSIDAAWLLDLGIVGPPFPLIGPEGVLGLPGIPVLNVGVTFP